VCVCVESVKESESVCRWDCGTQPTKTKEVSEPADDSFIFYSFIRNVVETLENIYTNIYIHTYC